MPINSAYRTAHRPGHNGVDQAAPRGTPILASNGGRVIDVVDWCTEGDHSCGGKFGNHIIIQHANGVQTIYAHLQTVNVKRGNSIGRGDTIAALGNTGRSTGPHLHFEYHINTTDGVPYSGQRVNPEFYVHR